MKVISFRTSNVPSSKDLFKAYYEKGECELEIKDYVSALMSFKKAL